MSNITLTITIPDPATVLERFDVVKVYRSQWGAAGDFVEVSTPGTRIPIVSEETSYSFVDQAGDPAYYYKTAFYNSGTEEEDDPSAAAKGDLCGNYVCVQDLREEGFTSAKLSDARALELIQRWEGFVEDNTGQWFYPRQLDMEVDGSGSWLLQLPVAIIRVDELRINGSKDPLPESQYVVYNRTFPDDRQNPRIKIKSAAASEAENFYAGIGGDLAGQLYSTLYGLVFKRGERNQVVSGMFGYVEANGAAPVLIKFAVKKLIALNSGKLAFSATATAGPISKEVTDRHSITYSEKLLTGATLSGDPEIDRILVRYRRPAVIDAPYGEIL